MVAAFVVLSASASWSRRLPPLIGALVVGALAIALMGAPAAASGQLPQVLAHRS